MVKKIFLFSSQLAAFIGRNPHTNASKIFNQLYERYYKEKAGMEIREKNIGDGDKLRKIGEKIGDKNLLKSIPTVLKIGVKIDDDLVYPVIASDKQQKSIIFPIEITPGEYKSSELSNKIKKYWITNVKDPDLENKIKKIKMDDIQRLIPAGKGKIKK